MWGVSWQGLACVSAQWQNTGSSYPSQALWWGERSRRWSGGKKPTAASLGQAQQVSAKGLSQEHGPSHACACKHCPQHPPAHTCSDTMAQRPGIRAAHFVLLTRGP